MSVMEILTAKMQIAMIVFEMILKMLLLVPAFLYLLLFITHRAVFILEKYQIPGQCRGLRAALLSQEAERSRRRIRAGPAYYLATMPALSTIIHFIKHFSIMKHCFRVGHPYYHVTISVNRQLYLLWLHFEMDH